MNNIPCGIIKDLLPSYCDSLCGDETKFAVEMHIENCVECKRELEKMQTVIGTETINDDSDKKAIERISKFWNRSKKRALIKGVLITATACAVLIFAYNNLFVREFPIKPNEVSINAYMLENGKILCEYSFVGGKPNLATSQGTLNMDGSYYAAVTDTIIKFDKVNKVYYAVYSIDDFSEDRKMKVMYYGTKDDNVLIWQEGMTLPPADKYLEEIYGKD